MLSYKLFYDKGEVQPPSPEWVVARSLQEVADLVRTLGIPLVVSHDDSSDLENWLYDQYKGGWIRTFPAWHQRHAGDLRSLLVRITLFITRNKVILETPVSSTLAFFEAIVQVCFIDNYHIVSTRAEQVLKFPWKRGEIFVRCFGGGLRLAYCAETSKEAFFDCPYVHSTEYPLLWVKRFLNSCQ